MICIKCLISLMRFIWKFDNLLMIFCFKNHLKGHVERVLWVFSFPERLTNFYSLSKTLSSFDPHWRRWNFWMRTLENPFSIIQQPRSNDISCLFNFLRSLLRKFISNNKFLGLSHEEGELNQQCYLRGIQRGLTRLFLLSFTLAIYL